MEGQLSWYIYVPDNSNHSDDHPVHHSMLSCSLAHICFDMYVGLDSATCASTPDHCLPQTSISNIEKMVKRDSGGTASTLYMHLEPKRQEHIG